MIGFAAPWMLWGLAALPLIWLLLRAVPPAALRKRFPAFELLLGLKDTDSTSARTPWWLLALRSLALALLIIGFAGPGAVVPTASGGGPLVIALDGTWASARDWPTRRDLIARELDAARDRPVALVMLSNPPAELTFTDAASLRTRIPALEPRPWGLQSPKWADAAEAFDTVWLSDGVEHPTRAELRAVFTDKGTLRVIEPQSALSVLSPLVQDEDALSITATRIQGEAPAMIRLIGPDPAGITRVLHEQALTFDGDLARADLDLPHELRNRLRRVEIAGQVQAGGVHLLGDSLRRPRIALIAGGGAHGGQVLLDPLHYLREALRPQSEIIEVNLLRALEAAPDVIILSDLVGLAPVEAERLDDWITQGGTLIRFAGPAMAAADLSTDEFLAAPLRSGGRNIGGAMSWGSPKAIAPFAADGPFAGLPVPDEVQVSTQVLAQPGPDLAARVIAELRDGTPLVTRRDAGAGQVILFHVSSDAEWSSLPISGLFPQMLARLTQVTGAAKTPEAGQWVLDRALTPEGELSDAPPMAAVPAADLTGDVGPDLPPGLYAHDGQRWPVNIITTEAPGAAIWPATTPVDRGVTEAARPLAGWAIAAGVALLAVDIIGSLAVAGRLAAVMLAVALIPVPRAQAQDLRALDATREVVMGHILTGDPEVDALAHAGLAGLGNSLRQRSSIEPGPPLGVDLETDELAFFPMLYWPVTADFPLPSADAISKLRAYVQSGGMIVFDTRDGDIAGITGTTKEAERLRVLAGPLGLPALEPVPEDHVMTRSFYLLDEMPGRYRGDVWVEAAPRRERREGVPFAQGNDGVSPIVISGNDWIGAWAVDAGGNRMLPVGRGTAGERQRELAYRFGMNLMMYALTGNYKSDQVHVPALLQRLGEE